jgi:signal transduction histidine kinase
VDGDGWEEARLARAVDVFRVAALLYAAVLHVLAHDEYRRPWAGWVVLGVLAAWTAYLLVRPGRPGWVLVTDLTLACAAVLATRFVDDLGRIAQGAQTLPSIYPGAVVLTWALCRGWRGGLVAAVVVALADLLELTGVAGPTAGTINNIVLLVLTALVVGYGLELVRAGRADLAAAVEVRAATAERERLARDIHDSVLQVLGFVRRGAEAGARDPGRGRDLARLAGEAEARLRGLVATGPAQPAAGGTADLRRGLAGYEREDVTVSGPAGPVLLPAAVAAAVTAAVGAALDNVAVHAGPGAKTWVLLEDEPDQVTVTVRDDGAGFGAGRLEAAAAEGRLGVAASIRGRIADVGGTVEVTSAPGQGCEVELRVPRGDA